MIDMEMERGPRYEAYSQLRETKLRMKYLGLRQRQQQYEYEEQEQETDEEPKIPTPPRKKQVKFQFQADLASGRKKGSSFLAQSVPDFSATLRKENRKPLVNTLPSTTVMELTPPLMKSKSFSKGCGVVLSSSRGSMSANAGEKRRGVGGGGTLNLMARKSYANIDELRSFSSNAINNGESRGGGGRNNISRVVERRTVLRCREL